mmetsp:Transcript_61661/g.130137  ORF Transcript_61661/g.130137 Transcript_61661/m.130137 type:complete len:532 (+) Transcript_61661:70-1665(+)
MSAHTHEGPCLSQRHPAQTAWQSSAHPPVTAFLPLEEQESQRWLLEQLHNHNIQQQKWPNQMTFQQQTRMRLPPNLMPEQQTPQLQVPEVSQTLQLHCQPQQPHLGVQQLGGRQGQSEYDNPQPDLSQDGWAMHPLLCLSQHDPSSVNVTSSPCWEGHPSDQHFLHQQQLPQFSAQQLEIQTNQTQSSTFPNNYQAEWYRPGSSEQSPLEQGSKHFLANFDADKATAVAQSRPLFSMQSNAVHPSSFSSATMSTMAWEGQQSDSCITHNERTVVQQQQQQQHSQHLDKSEEERRHYSLESIATLKRFLNSGGPKPSVEAVTQDSGTTQSSVNPSDLWEDATFQSSGGTSSSRSPSYRGQDSQSKANSNSNSNDADHTMLTDKTKSSETASASGAPSTSKRASKAVGSSGSSTTPSAHVDGDSNTHANNGSSRQSALSHTDVVDKRSAAAHAEGRCNPCIFFYKGVCHESGSGCEHCHFQHTGRQFRSVQPSKTTRSRLRQLVAQASVPEEEARKTPTGDTARVTEPARSPA